MRSNTMAHLIIGNEVALRVGIINPDD